MMIGAKKCILMSVLLVASVVPVTWSANIAVLVNANLFEDPALDPITFPDDKAFLLESIELLQPGIFWLINHFENDLGHTCNIYNSNTDVPADVENANDLIFVTESLGSGSIGNTYAVTNKPFISTELFVMDDMGISGNNFTGGAFNERSTIEISASNHPIAQGLPASFSATVNNPDTGAPYVVTFGVVTANNINAGTVVAVLPASMNASNANAALPDNSPLVVAVEAGEAGNDARWVFFGYSDVNLAAEQGGTDDFQRTSALLNENGIRLLDNAIAWALGETTTVDSWSLY